jgi:glycosyltransferase involved in cell wall biosynthesis
VVDDGSQEGTWEALQSALLADPRVKLVRHPQNRGKGAALRTGFEKAAASIVLVQDLDLEYDPAEYSIVIAPILAGKADVVFGSRFMGAGPHRALYYWHFIATLSNIFTNF